MSPPIDAMLTMRPESPLPHVRENRFGTMQCPPEMHVHRLLVIAIRHMLERTDLYHARVIDEHVDAAEMMRDDLDRLLHQRPFGHIARNRQHAAVVAELILRAQQLFPIARQQRHTRAFLSKLSRHQQSKPARTARNDGDATPVGKALAGTSLVGILRGINDA